MSGGHDRALAAAFLVLGVGLLASSFALPEGVGREPGPGFFPRVIGGVTLLLAIALWWQSRRPAPPRATAPMDLRGVLVATGLLALYLLLWGSGFFGLRTAAFLLVLLRFLAQPWRTALAVSISLSVAVLLVFRVGLGVSLD